MLKRTLALAATVVAFGAADTARADIVAKPSISGAGTIVASGFSCEQKPPVSDHATQACGTLRAVAPPFAPARLEIHARAATGWQFASWTGCTRQIGSLCLIESTTDLEVSPRARFVDRLPPAPIVDLTVKPSSNPRYHEIRWTENEPGLTFHCTIDRSSHPCRPGLLLEAKEGVHEIVVKAIDASRNEGPEAALEHVIVDTALRGGQPEDKPVSKPSFSASSGIAKSFWCQVDNSLWYWCGTPTAAGADTKLKLFPVADGRHTLRVKGDRDSVEDLTPAARDFTVDTTPPETTIADTPTGLEIASTEAGELRCRVDDAPFEVCAAPHKIPVLAPGVHTFEAYATDAAGNADPTPAKHTWTVAAPKPVATPTPAPAREETKPAETTEAPVTVAQPVLAQPQRIAFALKYRFRSGRFTRFEVSGAGSVRVIVKRPGKRAVSTTVAKLVGKRLPNGTKITVRAGAEVRKLTIRRGRVIA
jgi:hypothetical protein